MSLDLILLREHGTTGHTAGRLFLGAELLCHTIEDQERPEKVYAQTAIPLGRYRVVITPSVRFQRDLPLLLDVPNYRGVRIHGGNCAADTEGCILVGDDPQGEWLGKSQQALRRILPRLKAAYSAGEEIWIEII